MKILPIKINKFFDSILSKLSVPKKDRNLLIKSLLDSSIRGWTVMVLDYFLIM